MSSPRTGKATGLALAGLRRKQLNAGTSGAQCDGRRDSRHDLPLTRSGMHPRVEPRAGRAGVWLGRERCV
eukprot:3798231-Prymnesium_polylepis.1